MIDKSIVNRMKRASAKTKDAANQQLQPEENSANFSANYAVDKTSKIARHAARKSGQQFQKTIKIGRKKGIQKSIQTILPSDISDSKKAIKKPLKSSIKKSAKGVKTTTLTSRLSLKTQKVIKTTQQTKRVIRSSARNAKRSMQATRATIKTIKTAVFTTKIAVKATIVAIKGAVVSTKALVTLAIVGSSLAVLIILTFTLFGAALTFSNESGDGDTTSILSDEALAHEPLIRHYAEIHGIPEHIPLIMAVMMQESGGRGLDPMQASESGYNTRFPRFPNAITYSFNLAWENTCSMRFPKVK